MVALDSLADTLIEQLKTRDLVRVAASEADYLQLAPGFPGKLEYRNGDIIAMSLATALHELLVMYIGRLLTNHFFDKDFLVTGSNAGLRIQQSDGVYCQPDLMVTRGSWQFRERSKSIITNPYIVVEILSRSTTRYDQEEKLPAYKDIDSLHYIVYVAQDRPYVSVWARTDKPNVWINADYRHLDSVADLGDLTLPLREIYHKITFEPPITGERL